jgi:prepilin-type N-terminal cleavage/methylation domain-containing protein
MTNLMRQPLRSAACRPQPATAGLRAAFTLVELLVVVMIMLVLTSITVATINITIDGDKVRSAARQIQSYLEGARSRASYSKEPRGVRFLLDPADRRTVTSLVYIAPTANWIEGNVFLARADGDGDGDPVINDGNDPFNNTPPYDEADAVWMVVGFDGTATAGGTPLYPSAPNPTPTPYRLPNNPPQDTSWLDLYRQGVLRDGNRIQIPAGSGRWYTVDCRYLKNMVDSGLSPSLNNPPRLLLQQKYQKNATTPSDRLYAFGSVYPETVRYQLELSAAPLPNQEPILLPRNVVIHLDRSSSDPDGVLPLGTPSRNPALRGNRLPNSWKVPEQPTPANQQTGFRYSEYCDLMFSPRGSVTGPEASTGLIHLYVGELKDADRDRSDWGQPAPGAGANWTAPEYASGQTASDPGGNPHSRGDKLVVSIFTRTGAITSNPVYVNADGSDNVAQRFRYSETGEVAGR